MGAQQGCCCEGEDSGSTALVPTTSATQQYKHAGTDDDEKTFDHVRQALASTPKKMEPVGEAKGQPAVPPLDMPKPSGGNQNGPVYTYNGRAGALHISLDRTYEHNIGLNLDALDEQTAFVDGVLPGAIDTWSRNNPGLPTLQAHDRIAAVNGAHGDTDRLLREMRLSTHWSLVVDRPLEVKLRVDCRKFPSLGLDLKYSPNGGTLLIAGIAEGAIKDWNKNTAGPKIEPRDRIVEVNGIRGTARKLLDTATDVNELTLTVLHYQTNAAFTP
jgi:hypothetical protein